MDENEYDPTGCSVTPRSPSSRSGLAAAERALSQCATAILDDVCARRHGLKQVGTKKRLSGRTKKR
ncbi:hypothetical protein, partial [Bradyrhizobium sp. LjRoot220]|uniref:hypothetical protein n=1 Tax=Bradyrhizobium sp. LjRoot220 TaxID=3342284 RepID=UPI003F4F6D75